MKLICNLVNINEVFNKMQLLKSFLKMPSVEFNPKLEVCQQTTQFVWLHYKCTYIRQRLNKIMSISLFSSCNHLLLRNI